MCVDCRWRRQNPWLDGVLDPWPCQQPATPKPLAPVVERDPRDPELRCKLTDCWPEQCGCAEHITLRQTAAVQMEREGAA